MINEVPYFATICTCAYIRSSTAQNATTGKKPNIKTSPRLMINFLYLLGAGPNERGFCTQVAIKRDARFRS